MSKELHDVIELHIRDMEAIITELRAITHETGLEVIRGELQDCSEHTANIYKELEKDDELQH